jgi:hypothetical protein
MDRVADRSADFGRKEVRAAVFRHRGRDADPQCRQAIEERIEMDTTQPTLLNRISFGFVLLLLAAVVFGAVSVVSAVADSGDQVVAHRDSGPGSGDDDEDNSGPGSGDDDDDDDHSDTGTGTQTGTGGTADSATGTTQGTGASQTATNDTATGTRTGHSGSGHGNEHGDHDDGDTAGTATGTTRGTGASQTATQDTATGTRTGRR